MLWIQVTGDGAIVETPAPYCRDYHSGQVRPADHVKITDERFVFGTVLQIPIPYKDGEVRDLSDKMAMTSCRCKSEEMWAGRRNQYDIRNLRRQVEGKWMQTCIMPQQFHPIYRLCSAGKYFSSYTSWSVNSWVRRPINFHINISF